MATAVRYEHPEDHGTEFRSLFDAIQELPGDPDSRIVAPGGRLLAESHPDRKAWILTASGKQLIEVELVGVKRSA